MGALERAREALRDYGGSRSSWDPIGPLKNLPAWALTLILPGVVYLLLTLSICLLLLFGRERGDKPMVRSLVLVDLPVVSAFFLYFFIFYFSMSCKCRR